MKLIVGLGNPGARYAATRHNIGFLIVDRFAAKHRVAFDRREHDSFVGAGRVAGRQVLVAKPRTYMNLSGRAVAGLCRSHVDELGDLIVVYDDVDLPLGKIRIRASGSAGSHNGMRSIVDALTSEQFPRLRFGIRGDARDRGDLADWVLEPFEAAEEPVVERAVETAIDALAMMVRDDLSRAMSRFNREPVAVAGEEAP